MCIVELVSPAVTFAPLAVVPLCSQVTGYNRASTRLSACELAKNAASSVTFSDTTAHGDLTAHGSLVSSRWLHGLSPAALKACLVYPPGRAKHRAVCPRLSRCSSIHCSRTPTTVTVELDDITTRSKPAQAPAARAIMRLAACSGQGRPCTMQTAPGRILHTYVSADRAM